MSTFKGRNKVIVSKDENILSVLHFLQYITFDQATTAEDKKQRVGYKSANMIS